MIPGDLLSAFPHRQFHTLPGLLDSWAPLPNSYPNALRAIQGGSLYHFYDGLWYDPAERRTHDLPCERRTRYRLSQPDTVQYLVLLSYGIQDTCLWCGCHRHMILYLFDHVDAVVVMVTWLCIFVDLGDAVHADAVAVHGVHDTI